jgi:hypothetical protein
MKGKNKKGIISLHCGSNFSIALGEEKEVEEEDGKIPLLRKSYPSVI